AYGVIEALRAEGIENMPIVAYDGNPEAVKLVMEGKLLATVFTNPHWGGGITAALAYYAATGAFKPSEEPKEHREFYGKAVLISHDNVEEYYKTNVESKPEIDWNDLWGRVTGAIRA
ncbi:MAG: ABC transporter substrate-binding protein, partial [Mesorhizobium sp.]